MLLDDEDFTDARAQIRSPFLCTHEEVRVEQFITQLFRPV